jgi:hypothetical protein
MRFGGFEQIESSARTLTASDTGAITKNLSEIARLGKMTNRALAAVEEERERLKTLEKDTRKLERKLVKRLLGEPKRV